MYDADKLLECINDKLDQKEEDKEDRETKKSRKDDLLDRVNYINKEEEKHFWTDLEKVTLH